MNKLTNNNNLLIEELQDYNDQEDISIKIVIVGDSGVGKSNIISRYIQNEFSKDTKATIGVELSTKSYKVNNNIYKIHLWDTAGQERYKSITSAYYKGAKAAVVVYDITKRETYENITKWLSEIKEYAGKDTVLIIIGNKNDLDQLRQVEVEEIKELGEEYNIAITETSALTSDGIEEAFRSIILNVINNSNSDNNGNGDNIDSSKFSKGVKLNTDYMYDSSNSNSNNHKVKNIKRGNCC